MAAASCNNGPATNLSSWLQSNTHHYKEFSLSVLASTVASKSLQITVIIPARSVACSIGGVLEQTVKPLVEAGIVSSVIAIDADSKDGTGAVAAAHGATVLQRREIAPELGGSLGKGDAMWRALLATSGRQNAHPRCIDHRSGSEIVAFLDGDTCDPSSAHLLGILGPLIMDDNIQMVRGCFDRPFKAPNGEIRAHEGGRVTELSARPLLNLHFPELSCFRQPLAGEFAARRGLLERLRFPVGYGIEIGTLIDAWRVVGLEGLAECDLGTRQNCHKPLRELAPMAFAVSSTLERRLDRKTDVAESFHDKIYLPWEGTHQPISVVERPPVQNYLENGAPLQQIKMSPNCPPFVDVPGVLNFRDIGGCPITPGVYVPRDLIYRSGDLKQLTSLGSLRLQALCVKTLFDLRSKKEVEKAKVENGDVEFENWLRLPDPPERVEVSIFDDKEFGPEALAVRFNEYASEGTEGFEKAYRKILLNSGSAIKAILSHLAKYPTPPSPILIYCTAGKDRTGVIVMVLLLLAGCSVATIAKEYALSEIGLGSEWKAEAVNRLIHNPIFEGKDIAGVERMVGARPAVMEAVVAMVEREWGSIQCFLTETIGIENAVLEQCASVLRGESADAAS